MYYPNSTKNKPRARPFIPWWLFNLLSLLALGTFAVTQVKPIFSLTLPQITITVGPQNADDYSRLPGN